jgi:hypothetical protein
MITIWPAELNEPKMPLFLAAGAVDHEQVSIVLHTKDANHRFL